MPANRAGPGPGAGVWMTAAQGSAGARSWSCVGGAPRLPTGTAPAPGSVLGTVPGSAPGTHRLAPPPG
ncbi:hypothetical protein PtA15_2A105, partial [Puccinia triticina]